MTSGCKVFVLLSLVVLGALSYDLGSGRGADDTWTSIIHQAKNHGLPTRFLETIAPAFVTLEFDDLHAFAAEYHPEEHRLVLNQALSFNAAGGALKPLARLAPRELGTLYHEFFHAYLDYLTAIPDPAMAGPEATELLALARDRQQCWYQQVLITPILQRKTATEIRFLTERESWEALNETWAVFVGWVIGRTVEWQRRPTGGQHGRAEVHEHLRSRLKIADQDGDLIGYYEPEQEEERSITRKRYLAPSQRITPQEARALLEWVLEFPPAQATRLAMVMEQQRNPLPGGPPCEIQTSLPSG